MKERRKARTGAHTKLQDAHTSAQAEEVVRGRFIHFAFLTLVQHCVGLLGWLAARASIPSLDPAVVEAAWRRYALRGDLASVECIAQLKGMDKLKDLAQSYITLAHGRRGNLRGVRAELGKLDVCE